MRCEGGASQSALPFQRTWPPPLLHFTSPPLLPSFHDSFRRLPFYLHCSLIPSTLGLKKTMLRTASLQMRAGALAARTATASAGASSRFAPRLPITSAAARHYKTSSQQKQATPVSSKPQAPSGHDSFNTT